MKFLFITPRYHINTHYLVKSLQSNQQAVSVFSLYQGQAEDYSAVSPEILGYAWFFRLLNRLFNFRDKRVMKSNFEMRYAHPDFFKLLFKIKKKNPDVLIIKNIQSLFSVQSLLIAKILRKQIIILMQLPKYRAKQKSWSVYLVGKLFGAKVLTPVAGDKQYPNHNDNLYYVPFVIDVEDFVKTYNSNSQINIICVGKIQERKGQIFLLEAVKNLIVKHKLKIKLDFYGEEDESLYLQKLQQYIKDHQLLAVATWHRLAPHAQMMQLYHNYDLFVLPSWSEAAAFSLLEAMSCKLPVICTEGNGTKNYIEVGTNGYVVPAKNAKILEEKIAMIVSDIDTINSFGQASFDLVMKNHNLNIFYQALMKILL